MTPDFTTHWHADRFSIKRITVESWNYADGLLMNNFTSSWQVETTCIANVIKK